jgi:ornithine--oxo-acid transaminase
MLRVGTAPVAAFNDATRVDDDHVARNYAALPVTLARGSGAWVEDVTGRRYLDLLAGYSALNFGHGHPRLLHAARAQLDRLTLTSRAFGNDQLGPFCRALATLCGKDLVVPMNTGAEAVETAIKAARRWGDRVKGVPRDRASIIVFDGNFHGRTTTIVGFSTDPESRDGFGPFTPGFRVVPYGDLDAVAAALDDTAVAVLVEPIQGEAGVVIPPAGFLSGLRDLCTRNGALLVVDEIQSGLGRTGRTFASDHDGVVPDLYVLGKALGGGIVPLSAVVGDGDVLGLLGPGSHGSTFGGNPLACAVGREVVAMVASGEYQHRAATLGARLRRDLDALVGRGITEVRSRGLWAGVDVDESAGDGRTLCMALLQRGVLAKEAHGRTIRIAPPLVIEAQDLRWGVEQVAAALEDLLP